MRHVGNYLLSVRMNVNSLHILSPLLGAFGVKEKTTKVVGKNHRLWSLVF